MTDDAPAAPPATWASPQDVLVALCRLALDSRSPEPMTIEEYGRALELLRRFVAERGEQPAPGGIVDVRRQYASVHSAVEPRKDPTP